MRRFLSARPYPFEFMVNPIGFILRLQAATQDTLTANPSTNAGQLEEETLFCKALLLPIILMTHEIVMMATTQYTSMDNC